MIPVEVSIVTVDPATIEQFEQTTLYCHNFFEWLKLFNMYKHNQMWDKVDQCMNEMNRRFIVKETFWVKELELRWNRLDYDNQKQIGEFWELMKRAFENEYRMHEFGQKLCNWVIYVYKNMNKFTLAQAQNKLRWLIERFKWDIEKGALYFEKLREIYDSDQVNKIRKAYHQEFANPFKSNDVILHEYKEWEKDEAEVRKAEQLYQKMLFATDQIITNIENRNFSKLPIPLALKLQHEDTQYNVNDYLKVITREVSDAKRVELLRKEAKQGWLEIQYLEELEKCQIQTEQELIKEYSMYIERTISHSNSTQIELIIKKYLCFLIRRVNKHLLTTQSQEYLDSWGQKVTFLRQQIVRLIPRTYKSIQLKLYSFWADIETYVIKDVNTACSVHEQLIVNTPTRSKVYIDYAHSMVVLGDVTKAMEVMKRGMTSSDDTSPLETKLKQMIELFGSIQQNVSKLQESKQEQEITRKQKQNQEISKQSDYKPRKDIQKELDFAHKRPLNQNQDETTNKIIQQEKQRYHSDSTKTLFLKGVPQDWLKADVLNLFENKDDVSDVRIVTSHKKRRTNQGDTKYTTVCYVDMTSQEAAEKAIQSNRRKDITMELSKPPRQGKADDRTILLAGLATDATQKDISEFLEEYVGVEDIRLLYDQHGSRGLAFIQFASIKDYQQAWTSLLKRKLIIKEKGFVMRQCDNYRTNTKNLTTVVFIEGLAYKATQNDIERFFKSKGISNIKDIEIAKNEQRQSKGFAYVDFSVYKDYQSALDLQSGQILGREIKIKKSDRKITQKKLTQPDKQMSNSDFLNLFK